MQSRTDMVIAAWTLAYSVVVAASIMLLGRPAAILGTLGVRQLVSLLADWRFLAGGVLALCARFIFVIINNLAAKSSHLHHAHLSITALASTASIATVLIANAVLLHERLGTAQMIGAIVIVVGISVALQ